MPVGYLCYSVICVVCSNLLLLVAVIGPGFLFDLLISRYFVQTLLVCFDAHLVNRQILVFFLFLLLTIRHFVYVIGLDADLKNGNANV